MCRHGRHGPPPGPPGPRPASLALLAAGDAPVDPQASLEALARRLEAAHEADPGNTLAARELRLTLQVLAGEDPDAGFDAG